jgi:hypothetical protein
MGGPMGAIARSPFLQSLLTVVTYALYACVLGAGLAPAALFVWWARWTLLPPGGPFAAGRLFLFCLCLGAGLFVFLFFVLVLIALVVRMFSVGVKPGRHHLASAAAWEGTCGSPRFSSSTPT